MLQIIFIHGRNFLFLPISDAFALLELIFKCSLKHLSSPECNFAFPIFHIVFEIAFVGVIIGGKFTIATLQPILIVPLIVLSISVGQFALPMIFVIFDSSFIGGS